jgi:hypothetical protein
MAGRHSAASQLVLEHALEGARLEPPRSLSAEERADWTEIVACYPAGYFDAANGTILAELVRAMSHSRMLSEQLDAMRKCSLISTTAKGTRQRTAFLQLAKMHIATSRMVSVLATKLRLPNSSYRRDRYDERKMAMTPSGPRPWET